MATPGQLGDYSRDHSRQDSDLHLQNLEAGKRFELAPIVYAVIELTGVTRTEVSSLRAIGAVASLLDETLAAGRASAIPTEGGAGR